MTNCCIYSRVSTGLQDFSRQTTELKAYAQFKGWNVVKEFEEKVSGTVEAKKREKFNSLLNFINENPALQIDQILIWELSRLGRNLLDVLNTINELTERRINIYIHKESLNTLNPDRSKNHIASMLVSLLGSFAEMELETTRSRIISGLRNSKSLGGANGAINAYGYKTVDKKIFIDEVESPVIKEIFNLYLSGKGVQQVAKYLNVNNVPTKRNKSKWSDKTVNEILQNPIYTGKRVHKGETFIFENLRLIPDETFILAQNTLKEKYNKQGINAKYVNNLKNKIVCGECGLGYYMHKRSDMHDHSYKCLSKRYYYKLDPSTRCKNPSIGIERLDNAIYKLLTNREINVKSINNNIQTTTMKEIDFVSKQLKYDEKELSGINEQIRELIQLKLTKKIGTNHYNEQYDILTNAVKTIENKLSRNHTKLSELKRELEVLKNSPVILNESNFREVVQEYVDKIEIKAGNPEDTRYPKSIFQSKQDIPVYVYVTLKDKRYYELVCTQRSNNSLLLSVWMAKPTQEV